MQSAEQEAELERYHSNINQVWFTGMHSDVGGSYNQTGLAYVTMEWMMVRAQFHGLDFIIGSQNDVASKANSHGKLHDSRNGPAVLYRYAPRDIGKLCTDKGESIVKSINIHESVLERMDLATARYAAGLLPESFTIVGSGMNYRNVEMDIETGSNNDWTEDQSSLRTIHTKQRRHYRYFADACFLLLAFALYMWWPGIGEIAGIAASPTELSNHLGQVAYYFTPQVFDPFIKAFIVERPLVFGVILIGFGAIYLRRRHLRKAALEESIKVRDKVMARRNEIVSKLEVMTE